MRQIEDSTGDLPDWLPHCLNNLRAALERCVTLASEDDGRLLVQTFGGLVLTYGGRSVELKGKGRALFVELLAQGGHDVSAARVAAALWPHGEHDYAMGALNTTLYRMRRQPALDGVIRLHDGRLDLSPRRCVVDRWLVESALDSVVTLMALGDLQTERAAVDQMLGVVVSAYRGPLLEQDDGDSVRRARERLRTRIAHVLARADALLRSAGDATSSWLARVAANDPCELMLST